MKEIAVSIDEDGSVRVDARGFTGKACESDIERVLAALRDMGVEAKTLQRNLKPEYHVKAQERQQAIQG